MTISCCAPNCTAPARPPGLLCEEHLKADPGKRGGWLSAHRRRLARGGGVELDARAVGPRLWVGAAPPFDNPLPGYTMLVLCAREIQPERPSFAGRLVRCPLEDDPRVEREQAGLALAASRRVAHELATGGTVLVTCAQGINRSALVAGLALLRLTRMSALEVVTEIRNRRNPRCLFNTGFVALLERFASSPSRR